jgi:hypothetical protein
MKVRTFDSQEAWLNWRLGKITGSGVKDTVNLRDGAIKAGVWRAAAESIIGSAVLAEETLTSSQVMDRGHKLEPIALARFAKETGKKVDGGLIGWESDDDMRMAVSPDGVVGKTAAIEVKCLLSPKHVEALYTRDIPKNTGGYEEQLAQYFIVNEKLTKVYYVFYHPDFPAPLDFFYLTFTRKDLQKDIERILAAEREAVGLVRAIVNAVSLYSPEEIAKVNAVKEELLADAQSAHAAGVAKVRSMMSPNTTV